MGEDQTLMAVIHRQYITCVQCVRSHCHTLVGPVLTSLSNSMTDYSDVLPSGSATCPLNVFI
jgi:hypothetical protein